jgi:hypothetical protein
MYEDRIKVIWNRQVAALSSQSDRRTDRKTTSVSAQRKHQDHDEDGSDDEEFVDALAAEMTDQKKTNQLISSLAIGVSRLRTEDVDQNLIEDAQALVAFREEQEDVRRANAGNMNLTSSATYTDRKVIRRKITTTQPDGQQKTTFKFVIEPNEVHAMIARLEQGDEASRKVVAHLNATEQVTEENSLPGHAMFEEDDNLDLSSRQDRFRFGLGVGFNASRPRNLQLGKRKAEQLSIVEE